MDYDDERLRAAIDRAIRPVDDATPAFYAVSGSHLYGFPSPDGDVDVRGFHVVDAERYALLDRPREQVVVNQGEVAEGFEDYPEVDLVSYELRKFGALLYGANFNVIEVALAGDRVLNDVPEELAALERLVEAHLPLDVPRAYLGMARDNYRTYLDPDRDASRPTAKTCLYVLRGLLAARYVRERATIEPDVFALAEHGLGSTALIEDLVAVKRAGEDARVGPELADRAEAAIVELFDELDPPADVDKTDYRRAIDDWMLTVRA